MLVEKGISQKFTIIKKELDLSFIANGIDQSLS